MTWPTRFLAEVGTRARLRMYWGVDSCPDGYGYHNALIWIADSDELDDWKLGGEVSDYAEDRWPVKCDQCDATPPPVPAVSGDRREGTLIRQVFHRRLYRASDGRSATRRVGIVIDEFSLGDLYYVRWHDPTETCHHGWTNCDGRHLVCEIPDVPGRTYPWDVDSRASNCTLPDDTLHRCWVRHGRPELGEPVHVDKAVPGLSSATTCGAGRGSIDNNGKWHGHLHHGVLHA